MSRIGFHVTTAKKLERYRATGGILPPVRFWPLESVAKMWSNQTGRTVILKIEAADPVYPLPDHRQFGVQAYWSDGICRKFEEIQK